MRMNRTNNNKQSVDKYNKEEREKERMNRTNYNKQSVDRYNKENREWAE